MAVVEVSITPLGTATPSVSEFVAGCLKLVKASGLKYQLTPMGTVIEGDLDSILRVVHQMHEAPFKAGAMRVSTLIKIDDRRDRPAHTMADKMRAVEEKL
ncbi:MAG TPA: MTH1187 family thiamine-binding protein [Desulfuromonadales bacterium]|nr:MTH1187 family thiamine-binding protein [Desulfuromonadales bacterium]